MAIATKSI